MKRLMWQMALRGLLYALFMCAVLALEWYYFVTLTGRW